MRTPDDNSRPDDVEKFLSEQKSMEDRKQVLIAELLRQNEAAMKAFDAKLAKLGYKENSSGKTKRSHHKKPVAPVTEVSKGSAKPKA